MTAAVDLPPRPSADEDASRPAPYTRKALKAVVATGSVLVAVVVVGGFVVTADRGSTDEELAAVEPVVVEDSFDRRDPDSLGHADSGQRWSAEQGVWATTGTEAGVRVADGELPSLAVVDIGEVQGTVRAVLNTIQPGAGLIFWFQDRANYSMVTARSEFGTWGVTRVVNGVATDLGPVGVAATADGTEIAVGFHAGVADVFVNDAFAQRFPYDVAPTGTQVGLVAADGATRARWTEFAAENDTASAAREH